MFFVSIISKCESAYFVVFLHTRYKLGVINCEKINKNQCFNKGDIHSARVEGWDMHGGAMLTNFSILNFYMG